MQNMYGWIFHKVMHIVDSIKAHIQLIIILEKILFFII